MCDHCEEQCDNVSVQYRNYKLCDDCNDKYDDKTGFCSLYCCVTGTCDEVC